MWEEWIKMRRNLAADPAVIAIAAALELSEDCVVGKLHKFWSWADEHTTDGNAAGVTKTFLERYIGVTGFADLMVKVGWLTLNDQGISIPNFDRHNGNSAKRRALTARRVQRSRVTQPALPRNRSKERESRPCLNGQKTQFDQFWEVYPRKVKKKQAEEVWARIDPDDKIFATIMAGLTKQAASAKWKNEPQFIPHPPSWLNGRRWEDQEAAPADLWEEARKRRDENARV